MTPSQWRASKSGDRDVRRGSNIPVTLHRSFRCDIPRSQRQLSRDLVRFGKPCARCLKWKVARTCLPRPSHPSPKLSLGGIHQTNASDNVLISGTPRQKLRPCIAGGLDMGAQPRPPTTIILRTCSTGATRTLSQKPSTNAFGVHHKSRVVGAINQTPTTPFADTFVGEALPPPTPSIWVLGTLSERQGPLTRVWGWVRSLGA